MAHSVYTADLLSLIQSTGLTPHAYADDTQMGTCIATFRDGRPHVQ